MALIDMLIPALNPQALSPIPWVDLLGIFLMLTGFILGLGGVTVIDIHSFLGRRSAYWTEATTRTHKITKPLIWSGLVTCIIGAIITYRHIGLTGIPLLQFILAIVLIINGAFLTWYVSPFLLKREKESRQRELVPMPLQQVIFASFTFSFIGWWTEAVLFAVYLVMY